MAEQKQVKYDLDGYDVVTKALMELLNQFPGMESGEQIEFSELGEESGFAMYPINGAAIESERTSVTGKVTEVCLYPFYIIFRGAGLNEKRRIETKERLDNIGKWLEGKEIKIDDVPYKLSEYPPLTGNRKFLEFRRQTPAYLDNTYENQSEDWAIYISARYQNEYEK